MELLKIEFINFNMKNKIEDFSKLVSRHSYLIKNAELLVDVISFVLLVQMLLSCFIFCAIGKYFLNSSLHDTNNVVPSEYRKSFLLKKVMKLILSNVHRIFPNPIL